MKDRSLDLDLERLLHPAQVFGHPSEVVNDPDLTLNEKRAILASWASDACAVEAAPQFRLGANGSPARFDDIMDALRTLDQQSGAHHDSHHHPRTAKRRVGTWRSHSGCGDSGSALH
jgi:hypothetical protein